MSDLGIVLSGGGARGAYEVGVLSYLFGDFARRYGRYPHFDIICGTSVGAVNGAALASVSHEPAAGVELLRNVWLKQTFNAVFRFGIKQASSLYRVWLGGPHPTGFFDSRPLARTISHEIPWRQLVRNLKANRFKALTVSATNVTTGRATLYVDRAPGVPLPQWTERIQVRSSHILPHHVLASAAMPMVFPPVRIGNEFFCDGGVRLNTPTAPAIHLGANKLFVIGVSTPGGQRVGGRPPLEHGRAPGAPFLIGKALNALMLDHIDHDLEQVNLINQILSDGIDTYGDKFLERLNARQSERGHTPRRIVQTFALRPSVCLGSIAGHHLRTHWGKLDRMLGRTALRLLDAGQGEDADLASYLLFDGDFARVLIDLGRHDAEAVREEMADFLFAGPPHPGDELPATAPPTLPASPHSAPAPARG